MAKNIAATTEPRTTGEQSQRLSIVAKTIVINLQHFAEKLDRDSHLS
jgi:hypothetical protein